MPILGTTDFGEYNEPERDICEMPDCWNLVSFGHTICKPCAGRLQAEQEARDWQEREVPAMLERHRQIKAGERAIRQLDPIAPIVRAFWRATDPNLKTPN